MEDRLLSEKRKLQHSQEDELDDIMHDFERKKQRVVDENEEQVSDVLWYIE